MSDEKRKLMTACPSCGGPVSIAHKVEIETVRREHGRDLPVGDRTDIFKVECFEHGTVDRIEVRTPAGQQPDLSFYFEVPPLAPEPRWHEIATEGLPPERARVLVGWLGHEQVFAARKDTAGDWRNDYGDRVHGPQPTHWHEMPAPPTKEPSR